MLPILINFGPVKIYSYGLLFFGAIFVGLYWWWKIGRDEHWDETKLFDIFFIGLFCYFVFGRLGYVVMHQELKDFGQILELLTHPGLFVPMGVLGSFGSTFLLARKNDWEIWRVMDTFAVVLATILVVGSMGAILNGSNPGLISQWGIVHPGQTDKRIPIDVFAFGWSLVAFGVVSRVRKNFRFYSWYKGEASVAKEGLASLVFLELLGLYWLGIGWLDDGIRWYGIPILTIVGGLMVVGVGCMIYLRSGKNRGEELLAILRRKRS